MLFEARQVEWSERSGRLLATGPDRVRSRDQPRPEQVAIGTERALLGELRRVSAHRRDRARLGVLDVDVERPRARIFELRDAGIARRDAVDRQTLHAARIFFKIRIAEDSDRAWVGLDLL